MKLGINVMTPRLILLLLLPFHVTNIMNMTAVQSYGIWATWLQFRSQALKCCDLTNLRKYTTVITVIFISGTKNKNILSDKKWEIILSQFNSFCLTIKLIIQKNRNRYMAYICVLNVCVCLHLCACLCMSVHQKQNNSIFLISHCMVLYPWRWLIG